MIRTTAKEGWAAAEGPRAVVVVASQLTPDLIAEGLVREVVHAVQSQRKTLDLEFTDRIELAFETASPELQAAIDRHLDYVASETLATSATFGRMDGVAMESLDIDGHPLTIAIRRSGTSHAAGGGAS
jgi:isoleucyl-tRNA synthetase